MNIVNNRFGYIFNLLPATFAVFFFLFSVLNLVGFVPEAKENTNKVVSGVQVVSAHEIKNIGPARIIIDAIDVDATVVAPDSRDITVMDDALRDGVVHYPGSGSISDDGTMFLFGHSSSLPVIYNEMYKVFNHLSELKSGNTIRIQGGGIENVYRVTSVTLVDSEEALVDLSSNDKSLIISTCNSFGSKSERFVVHANFVGSYVLN